MAAIEEHHIYGLQVRESANDGSDFTNPDADYRIVFLGEDGLLHAKDSSGTVTGLGGTGLTNPMTTQDDIIVGGASGTPARLGKGTDGQVLTVDPSTHHLVWADNAGAADILDLPTAETDTSLVLAPDGAGGVEFRAETGGSGGGGLVFLEAHTASSSASLDFTSAISSSYDEYVIEGVGLVAASNAVNFLMAFSSNGGSSWLSGSTYEWNYFYLRGNSDGLVFGAPDTAAHIANANSNASNANLSFTMRLYNPNEAVYTRFLWDVLQPNSGDSGNIFRYVGQGSYLATTALNAVQFAFSSGNITSGVIRIYGMAKS